MSLSDQVGAGLTGCRIQSVTALISAADKTLSEGGHLRGLAAVGNHFRQFGGALPRQAFRQQRRTHAAGR
jgi:hypothetical protein